MSDSKKRDFNLLRLESDRFFLRGTKSSLWKRVVAWEKSGRPVEGVEGEAGREKGQGGRGKGKGERGKGEGGRGKGEGGRGKRCEN